MHIMTYVSINESLKYSQFTNLTVRECLLSHINTCSVRLLNFRQTCEDEMLTNNFQICISLNISNIEYILIICLQTDLHFH